MQPSLDDIGIKHGTDKTSPGHNYRQFYERSVSRVRNERLKTLKTGIGGGPSLKACPKYFPQVEIVGTALSTRRDEDDRVRIEIADRSIVDDGAGSLNAFSPS